MNPLDSKATATCRNCPKLCRHVCPPALGEMRETLTPTLKMHLVGLWQEDQLTLDQDLVDVFYACNDCGACTSRCQLNQEPAATLYEARKIAYQKQIIPDKVKELMERFHTHGNPYGPLQDDFQREQSSTQLLPGCATWFHEPDEVEHLRLALQQSHTQAVKVCHPEHCCGAALHAAGAEQAHRQHANLFVHHHRQTKTLVVADPHCAHHIRTVYPKLGLNLPFQVIHYLQALDPKNLSKRSTRLTKDAFYLDPSPLGRHSGVYELPRNWIRDLGFQVLEFPRSRAQAMDSGAGGIYRWTSPEGAKRHAHQWLEPVRRRQSRNSDLALFTVGETERSHLRESDPSLTIHDLNVVVARALLGKSEDRQSHR